MRRVLLYLVLAATPAFADPSPQDAAKAHFKQGQAYREAGEYTRAADEFKAAYALDPRAEMLFNIAQAYRLGGDTANAIDFFKQYLAAQPDGEAADEARVKVAELQRQLDDARAREQAKPPPPPPVPEPHLPEVTQRVEMVQTSPTMRIAGLATAGVGVVALAVGVRYGLVASSDGDYITNFTGTWGPTEEQRYLEGQAANRDMKIAYVVGGGLVAIGAGMFFWGSHLQALPVASPQTVGIAMAGRF